MPLICSAPYVALEGLVTWETVVIDSAAQAAGKQTAITAAIPAVILNAFKRSDIFRHSIKRISTATIEESTPILYQRELNMEIAY